MSMKSKVYPVAPGDGTGVPKDNSRSMAYRINVTIRAGFVRVEESPKFDKKLLGEVRLKNTINLN